MLRHRSGRVLEVGSVHVIIPSTQRASSDPSIGNMCISRSDAFTNITEGGDLDSCQFMVLADFGLAVINNTKSYIDSNIGNGVMPVAVLTVY